MRSKAVVYAAAFVTGVLMGVLAGYLKGLNDMDEAYQRKARKQCELRERYR